MRHITRMTATPKLAVGPGITIYTKDGCNSVPSSLRDDCKLAVMKKGEFYYEDL